jgi:hypothetical protein
MLALTYIATIQENSHPIGAIGSFPPRTEQQFFSMGLVGDELADDSNGTHCLLLGRPLDGERCFSQGGYVWKYDTQWITGLVAGFQPAGTAYCRLEGRAQDPVCYEYLT